MIFDRFPVDQAIGVILAHSQRLRDRTIKKGKTLDESDIAALAAAGVSNIAGARLDAGDIGEDDAAGRVAGLVAGPGTVCTAAFTGRCNVIATHRGLADVDQVLIDRLNRIDEAVTIATVPPGEVVEERQILATVKVIPFAIPGSLLSRYGFLAASPTALRVRSFRSRRTGLILTTLPGMKPSVLDQTSAVVRDRLDALAGELVSERRCEHNEVAVAAAVEAALREGCEMVLLSGASVTVDRRDVIPAGIVRAGGTIEHFGMPVDPGNLLLLARHGEVPVVGLPGCGRSPKLNGLDWVLRRLAADQPVRPADIMGMGVGGLLKDIAAPARPLPRARAVKRASTPTPRGAAKVALVVLAAGQSRRMGANKLLADLRGRPLVSWAVDAALASRASPVIVVTGHQAEAVRAALADRAVQFVHNQDYAEGMAGSLRRGIEALPADVDAVVVLLGDMPRITGAHIDRLIEAYSPAGGRIVCVPANEGRRGNPVLIGRPLFGALEALRGDVGARHVIAGNPDVVHEVEWEDDTIFADVDTAPELERVRMAQ